MPPLPWVPGMPEQSGSRPWRWAGAVPSSLGRLLPGGQSQVAHAFNCPFCRHHLWRDRAQLTHFEINVVMS